MVRAVARSFLVFLAVMLGGCAGPGFVAEVTQFHTLPERIEGTRFVLVPADEAKGDTLEFATYASRVVDALEARGFRQVARVEDSDVVVRLDYAIGPGTAESIARPVYGYDPSRVTHVSGVTRSGERFSARIYESGGHVPLGYVNETRIVYRRTLILDMFEAAQWRRGRTKKVFEGRVISIGPEAEPARVIPLMIHALFVDFPGPNGVTRTIVLDSLPPE